MLEWIAAVSPATYGYFFMILVALQVGLQPAVTRICVGESVSTKSLVIAENAVTAVLSLSLTTPGAFSEWSLLESLALAGPPAVVYAVRSLCKQGAYRHCDGVTFNIINQTKTVFCAIATWLFLGEQQTVQQCFALICAIAAGAMLVLGKSSSSQPAGAQNAHNTSQEKDDTPKAISSLRDGKEPPSRRRCHRWRLERLVLLDPAHFSRLSLRFGELPLLFSWEGN